MAYSAAETVEEYLQELPPDRRETIEAIRKTALENLPEGYVETMQHGMIAYAIPLERYPDTYNKLPLAPTCVASQKRHISIYLHAVYMDEELAEWFRSEWIARGHKLNMGKSCVRFRSLEDAPLDLIGEAVARVSVDDFIRRYEECRRR